MTWSVNRLATRISRICHIMAAVTPLNSSDFTVATDDSLTKSSMISGRFASFQGSQTGFCTSSQYSTLVRRLESGRWQLQNPCRGSSKANIPTVKGVRHKTREPACKGAKDFMKLLLPRAEPPQLSQDRGMRLLSFLGTAGFLPTHLQR